MRDELRTKVLIKRGKLAEKIYEIYYILIDEDLNILSYSGNINYITYSRSTAKPFQLIPLLTNDGHNYYNFNEKEISLMCSSHFAEDYHIETLKQIIEKIGINEDDLLCPKTYSRNKVIREEQIKRGYKESKLFSDCSAKHCQMIAYSLIKGYPFIDKSKIVYDNLRGKNDYYNYRMLDHPVQKDIFDIISFIYETDKKDIYIGIDGCGVPVFSSSIINMAKAYLKLILCKSGDQKIDNALNIIKSSMTKYPQMISGTDGLCSILTSIFNGNGIFKVGADGVYCGGFIKDNKAYAISLKVLDGNYEVSEFALVNILKNEGYLNFIDNIKNISNNLESYNYSNNINYSNYNNFSKLNYYLYRKNYNEHGEIVGDFELKYL
jgi:L-asparaginase II